MSRNSGPRVDVSKYRATADGWPDDSGCRVLHVDMDAFFASVEISKRPELRDRPVIVGGPGARAVVAAANYPARKFGVFSAMSMARARRLCPHGVFLTSNFADYRAVSAGVMGIFRSITPLVEPLSLDEAFLDVGGALRRLRMSPAQVGQAIRAQVFAEHGITCSVGVAPTKFIAKLASGMAKPDGMLVVPANAILDFLHPLPVGALWGVGARTGERLAQLGLNTVGDIAAAELPRLRRSLGVAAAEHLHALANGLDGRAVVPDSVDKSIGAEETFDVDHFDRALLRKELLRLAGKTGSSLRARGMRGRTVSIKVRYADFTTITRSRTLAVPTDVTQEIYQEAVRLLDEQTPPGAIRLLGVRVEQLGHSGDGGEQLALDTPEHGWREAEQAADQARSKFGNAAIRPASLL